MRIGTLANHLVRGTHAAPVCFHQATIVPTPLQARSRLFPWRRTGQGGVAHQGGAVARHVPRGGAWCGACVAPMSPRDRRCLPRFRIDLAVFLRWQARVLHIGIRIMPIEPCRLDQAHDGGRALAPAQRAAAASSNARSPRGGSGSPPIVVDRCIAVVKVARQRLPALEAVVDGERGAGAFRHALALRDQPPVQRFGDRLGSHTPTHSPSVERGSCRPARARMPSWRYSGKWSVNLATICAFSAFG